MKKIYALVILCLVSSVAFATQYFPNAVSIPSGSTAAYCIGQANVSYTAAVTICSFTSGGAAATNTITAQWYWNGTLVYTDPVTYTPSGSAAYSVTIPAGTFTLTPAGAYSLPGTVAGSGLFVRLTWTDIAAPGCLISGMGPLDGAPLTINVNDLPAPITGPSSVCVGSTITLADATTGGMWSSSAASTASAGTGGDILGVSAGTAVISYAAPTGCIATRVITVNASPAAISGSASMCIGSTTSLTDPIAGGTWSSSIPSVATVSSAGVVSGLSAGTSTISYIIAGCGAALTATVYAPPSAITGPSQVCVGNAITLADATPAGAWSSSNTSVATVDAAGVVNGIAAGGTLISYTVNGCSAVTTIVVNGNPSAITPVGTVAVCEGATFSLADATTGGTWTSGAAAIATVSSGGIVTGVSAGNAVISYVLTATGCAAVKSVTVNPRPAAIGGAPFVCLSGTATLTDATPGGTWTSTMPSVATITSSGVVNGITIGTAIVSYTLGTGCFDTAVVKVNNAPGPITGSANVCASSSTTLTDTVSGGAWTSGSTTIATVVISSGVVTGVSAGMADISYTIPGCPSVSRTVFVFPQPDPISGDTSVCMGFPSSLFDATPGGLWSSDDITRATVGPTSGVVTGVSMGTVTISYASPGGCGIGTTITVNPMAPLTGDDSVCIGGTTYLSCIVGGGAWSVSNPLIASAISATGAVTGLDAGATYLVYSLPSGCMDSTLVTVLPAPPAIGGPHQVCRGTSVTLSDAITGGAWSSANSLVATVGASSGVLTGIYPDTARITYTLPHHCRTSVVVTVNPVPMPTVSYSAGSHTLTVGPTTFASYQWYDSTNGIIAGATSPTLVIPGYSAFFYVVVTNDFGCTGTAGYSYTLPAGVGGYTDQQLRIYPNPATDIVHIDAPMQVRTVITSMEGRAVAEQAGTTVDISVLPQGVYLLMVYDAQGTRVAVEKITKQ